jgi:GrpB-like predicted nucleotidyltransferase (UPF0157 family)
MPTPEQITKHHEPASDSNPWVGEPPPRGSIRIVEHDETWPAQFEMVADRVRAALGARAIAVEHVGSTAVPGLAAKPTIDVDLTVVDPRDEAAYVPRLELVGFTLIIREPEWHEHRLLLLPAPSTHLHVFGPDCPELIRHRMFRDWLRGHPDDCDRYRRAKCAAAAAVGDGSGAVTDYNKHKESALREIYERMFRSAGLLP